MKETVIGVYGLSKKYSLDETTEAKGSTNSFSHKEFWALKDVSFELLKGDVLGIIGKNGAGKSTLLKILSGITPPSSGRVEIKGKFTSILEVGTGFHPDLTGSENIFLNANLLGVEKNVVRERFDEIIAFSEIEQFIDTPVKHYSSGMYVRLAAAVAFHVDADVLLMDEVLSVGDENFRQKTFQKINSITSNGTTVVLATHSLHDVMKFCNKCMLMESGTIVSLANPGETISKYIGSSFRKTGNDLSVATNGLVNNESANIKIWNSPETAPGTDVIRLHKTCIKAKGKQATETITTEDAIEVEILFWKLKADTTIQLHLVFFDKFDNPVLSTAIFHNNNNENLYQLYKSETGIFKMICEVPANFLYKGDYSIQLRFGRDVSVEEYIYKDNFSFAIHSIPGTVDYIGDALPIAVRPVLFWRHEKVADN